MMEKSGQARLADRLDLPWGLILGLDGLYMPLSTWRASHLARLVLPAVADSPADRSSSGESGLSLFDVAARWVFAAL